MYNDVKPIGFPSHVR